MTGQKNRSKNNARLAASLMASLCWVTAGTVGVAYASDSSRAESVMVGPELEAETDLEDQDQARFIQGGPITYQAGGGQVSMAGATLFVPFFQAAASTNDHIDVDGDGIFGFDQFTPPFVDQLATGFTPNTAFNTFFEVQYRSVGSVNGYEEFIDYHTCGRINGSIPAEFGLLNRFQWAMGGVLVGGASTEDCLDADGFPNPDADPSNDSGTPNCLMAVDVALLDVPSLWGTKLDGGIPTWDAKPSELGYGTNPILTSNSGYISNLQEVCRECPDDPGVDVCLNFDLDDPDDDTLYDTTIAWAPIVYIANRGVGESDYDLTDIRHLMVSGRLKNGENLATSTRSAGSGTRNGIMNTTGIDPSWGKGDNLDDEWPTTSSAHLGLNRRISNAQGSSQTEEATRVSRLAVGFTGLAGAGRAAADAAAGLYEILNIKQDDRGGTQYVRPTIGASLINCDPDTGYQLGGPVTFVSRGDPEETNNLVAEYMENQVAAKYLNNIVGSIALFTTSPGLDANLNMPGEYLANTFTLLAATDCLPSLTDPSNMIPNPDLNQDLQDHTLSSNTTVTPAYGSVNASGRVPTRKVGLYDDGQTAAYAYRLTDGSMMTISSGSNLAQRNRVQGDFNHDELRDVNDIDGGGAFGIGSGGMMKAFVDPLNYERNECPWNLNAPSDAVVNAADLALLLGNWGSNPAHPAEFTCDGVINAADLAQLLGNWGACDPPIFPMPGNPGGQAQNVVIVHVIGDFDGTGNFDAEDVRYFADGLALMNGQLNRKAGFERVDQAWDAQCGGDNNFFDTQVFRANGTTPVAYIVGASRADIAGNTPYPGAHPNGHDGRVDCQDVLHVAANLGDWSDLDQAVELDLSADLNGDLLISCVDLTEVLTIMGETSISACGVIPGCP